jgi:integrase
MVAARLLAARRPDDRLFTGPKGGRISTAVLRDATHWDDVVQQLGLKALVRHDLRHAGLTWMADAGVPVDELRKIAGYGSLSTTQRYLTRIPVGLSGRRFVGTAGFELTTP